MIHYCIIRRLREHCFQRECFSRQLKINKMAWKIHQSNRSWFSCDETSKHMGSPVDSLEVPFKALTKTMSVNKEIHPSDLLTRLHPPSALIFNIGNNSNHSPIMSLNTRSGMDLPSRNEINCLLYISCHYSLLSLYIRPRIKFNSIIKF